MECGDHQCEQSSSRWSSWLCARRLFRFSPACHVPGGITTTILAFGLIAPDDAHRPIIARSSLHPPSHCWPTALLSLFNLCGHLLLFRHPFSLDDTQDLVSKWPSTSESSMYGLDAFALCVGNTHSAKGPGLLECVILCTLALV